MNNYHEICTVGEGNAAFFDILAPPYYFETDDDKEDHRECNFFSEIGRSMPMVLTNNNPAHSEHDIHKRPQFVWLRRIKSPEDYFCGNELYKGPKIHSE